MEEKKEKRHVLMYVVAWDVIFLFPPAGTKRIFSNSQIFWKFFGLVERGAEGGGAGREGRREWKGKLFEKHQSTKHLPVSSTYLLRVSLLHVIDHRSLSI